MPYPENCMTDQVVRDVVINLLRSMNDEFRTPIPVEQGDAAPLFGNGGTLDSIELVSLVVALEQELENRFGQKVTLADERAFSASRSPFRTVGSLIAYVCELTVS